LALVNLRNRVPAHPHSPRPVRISPTIGITVLKATVAPVDKPGPLVPCWLVLLAGPGLLTGLVPPPEVMAMLAVCVAAAFTDVVAQYTENMLVIMGRSVRSLVHQ